MKRGLNFLFLLENKYFFEILSFNSFILIIKYFFLILKHFPGNTVKLLSYNFVDELLIKQLPPSIDMNFLISTTQLNAYLYSVSQSKRNTDEAENESCMRRIDFFKST
jgi:hypothetical protein